MKIISLIPNDKSKIFPPPEDYSIERLKSRLKTLKKCGFLEIFGKKRNAAIGESIEAYLGLKKDSLRRADWGDYELKSTTQGLTSKISLFNITLKYQNFYTARALVLEYGKPHHSKHLNKSVIRLDSEIKHSVKHLNSLHFSIPLEGGVLMLKFGEKIIAEVERNDLEKWFNQKFKNLVLISTEAINIGEKHGFVIKKANLLEITSFSNFIRLIHSNDIRLSFKMMLILPKTLDEKFNNRGVGFRATYQSLTKLYNSNEVII